MEGIIESSIGKVPWQTGDISRRRNQGAQIIVDVLLWYYTITQQVVVIFYMLVAVWIISMISFYCFILKFTGLSYILQRWIFNASNFATSFINQLDISSLSYADTIVIHFVIWYKEITFINITLISLKSLYREVVKLIIVDTGSSILPFLYETLNFIIGNK